MIIQRSTFKALRPNLEDNSMADGPINTLAAAQKDPEGRVRLLWPDRRGSIFPAQ